jgi:hypothetical protein
LGLKLEDPSVGDGSAAVDGQSVVTNPLLLEAILKGWANAQAELLAGRGPVQDRQLQPAPAAQKDELGEALPARHELLPHHGCDRVRPETSHMLLWGCYFGGSGFKKVYTHPLKKRPCIGSGRPSI